MLTEISSSLIFQIFPQGSFGLLVIIGLIALPFLYITMPIRLLYILFRFFKPNKKYFLKNRTFLSISFVFLILSISFVFDSWIYFSNLGTGEMSGLFLLMLSITLFGFYIGFEFFRFISFSKN